MTPSHTTSNSEQEDNATLMELRPCPFCGGKARLHDYPSYSPYVDCSECDCALDHAKMLTVEEAVAAWNRRSSSDEQAEVVVAWQKIDHPHKPKEADYERDQLRIKLEKFGPLYPASALQMFALGQPEQGSFAGSLWALAEWAQTVASPSGVKAGVTEEITWDDVRKNCGTTNLSIFDLLGVVNDIMSKRRAIGVGDEGMGEVQK